MANLVAKFKLEKQNEIRASFKLQKPNEIKTIFKIQKVVSANEIEEKLESEVDRATTKEQELQENLDGVSSALDFEIQARETADINIDSAIALEIANRINADNNLQAQIDTKQPTGDYATNSRVDGVVDAFDNDIEAISNEFEDLIQNKADKSEIPDISNFATTESLDIINNNLDALTGDIENISGELDNKQNIINDLDTIRDGANKGQTALQSIPSEYITETQLINKGYITQYIETDPIYLADKPNIAFKSDLPSTSSFALDNNVIHKSNDETKTGKLTLTGGTGGNNAGLYVNSGVVAGGYNVTGWTGYATHRLCNNQIHTGSFYINSDGSVIYRHKTGTALAEGNANDVALMLHPTNGITAGWSGKAGTATTFGKVLVDGFNLQKGITTSVASADGGEITLTKAFANTNYVVTVTPRAIGNYFVSCHIIANNKFKVRISDYYGNPVAISYSYIAIGD